MPHISFRHIDKIYPDGTAAVADLNLEVADQEFLCVLGPSGCGKSSTLRMLAGLETISNGDLVVDGRRINDVPPQARDIAMVFESYALYPHLAVYGNLAMPLVAQHRPRAEIAERVNAVAATLDIVPHLRKYPHQLSGGQRQRVAVGRAIIRTSKMFLMDEPLGHLEAYMRGQLRAEIRRLHEQLGATTIYITHDQEEAAAVADRIAVMNAGRLQQVGRLIDLLERPANRFVAEFVGHIPINLVPAEIETGIEPLRLRIGDRSLPIGTDLAVRMRQWDASSPLTLGIRPDDVRLADPGDASAIPARVTSVEPQGDTSIVVADTPAGRMRAVVDAATAPPVDAQTGYRFDLGNMHLFDAAGTNLLHEAGL